MSNSNIPPYGLTLQAPWGALVAWGGKRIENRSKGVATAVGAYRGRVALTASKCHTVDGRSRPFMMHGEATRSVYEDIVATLRECHAAMDRKLTYRDLADMAGTWFATARIEGILKPKRRSVGWHIAGQWGIVLTDIEVLEPFIPCTGGQGFFAFRRCDGCGRPAAKGAKHQCTEPISASAPLQLGLFTGADAPEPPR